MTSQNANELAETHGEEAAASVSSNHAYLSNDTFVERVGQASRDALPASSSASANDTSTSSAPLVELTSPSCRHTQIQKLPQRKRYAYNWSHNKKLCKLAIYSACQVPECPCTGWKMVTTPVLSPPGHSIPVRLGFHEPLNNFTDPCRHCKHQLEKHVTQLQGESVGEINRLLGAALDLENLFVSMHLEKDIFLKRGYYYVFKCLYKCVQARSATRIVGPLGPTPFERPSVAKAMANFILYKFNALHDIEWQAMYELAQKFLYCLNHLILELPAAKQPELRVEPRVDPEPTVYEKNYMRWFVACHVPKYCDSLPLFETSLVFGRQLLREVYKDVASMLVEKFQTDTLSPQRRMLYLRLLPQFLALFEVETFNNLSPIWDTQFHQLIDYEHAMIQELHGLIPPH